MKKKPVAIVLSRTDRERFQEVALKHNASIVSVFREIVDFYRDDFDFVFHNQKQVKEDLVYDSVRQSLYVETDILEFMNEFCLKHNIKWSLFARMIIKQFFEDEHKIKFKPKQNKTNNIGKKYKSKMRFTEDKVSEIIDMLFDYFCFKNNFAPKRRQNVKEDLVLYSKSDYQKIDMLLIAIKNNWKNVYPID
jgi:hypothetical protein